MTIRRYATYKPSGVAWLGAVPGHWDVQPIKRHTRQLTEKTNRRDHPVALENIQSWTGRYVQTDTEFECVGVAFSAGDILFGKLRPYLAKVLVAKQPGEAVGDFIVMRPLTGVFPQFASYQLLTREFIAIVDGSTFGSKMPRASWDFVSSLQVVLPPHEEQIAITSFLDHETAKIDALVEEQKRLIELLKEKRQAVISQAVTKGLDLTVAMKDSGVAWLGMVPAHWEVVALRRCASGVETGGTPSAHPPGGDAEDGLVWYTPGDFGESITLTSSARMLSRAAVEAGDAKVFPPGSVLIVSIGATLGKVGFAPAQSSANQQINAVVPNDRANGYFLTWSLGEKAEVMRFLSNASTIGIMNQEKTKDIRLALPPIAEQVLIASRLDQLIESLDRLTTEAVSAIALLQERRAALISAAVTGKIDVRERGDLVAAMADSIRDIAAGRFVIESAQAQTHAHVARIQASLKRDD